MARVSGVFTVNGPARVRIEGGMAEVLGYEMHSGEIIVPLGRRIPLRALEAELEVTPSPDRLSPGDPRLYEELARTARELAGMEPPVLLVGPSDVGKSTLAAMTAVMAGRGSSLLTVDVGQNEVYAPGFEALAVVEPPFIPGWVRGSEPLRCFVGSFTPSRRLSSYLGCAARLTRESKGFLVVDTDGWLAPWEGLYSKAALALAVGAATVVHLGLEEPLSRALESLLPGARHVKVKRALAPAGKSREERRAHRERLITARLLASKSRSVRLEQTPVVGLPLGFGRRLGREELESLGLDPRLVEWAEVTGGGEVVVVARRSVGAGLRVKTLRPGFEEGLIAAAYEPGGKAHLAVVEKLKYRTGTLTFLTEYEGPVALVEVGEARVALLK
ncbi:Clp1/GlmU family protein [Stetteria hydrogenophila]